MKQYLDLLHDVRTQGALSGDRTGTGTYRLFGTRMRFDLENSFPLLTTKRVFFDGVVHELLWFLSGAEDIQYLQDNGIKIWDNWATEDGKVGPMYGSQWRNWHGDQLQEVVDSLRDNPTSRRHIVSAWNRACLPHESMSPQENVRNGNMALAPCHAMFQFFVQDGKLSCQVYQRSADLFLGVPFNIASYALLTHIIAQQTRTIPSELIWVGGDTHIYLNHLDQVNEQLSRRPGKLPALFVVFRNQTLDDYVASDFQLIGYEPQPAIKAPISV